MAAIRLIIIQVVVVEVGIMEVCSLYLYYSFLNKLIHYSNKKVVEDPMEVAVEVQVIVQEQSQVIHKEQILKAVVMEF